MKKISGILFALALVGSLVLVTTTPVLAATIRHVPGDYPTIQAAVNAAADGDTIMVAAGTYRENVDLNKSLTLKGAQAGVDARSRSGPETIIEPAEGTGIRVITATNRVVVIDGLTVRNAEHGVATPEPTMAANITVRNVRVLNPTNFGISPTFTLATTVEYCYVEGAIQAINAGALIPFPATVATFRNNEIVNSQFGITGYLNHSLVEGNVIRDFSGEGVGISGQFLNTQIKNNRLSGYSDGAGLTFEWHYSRDLCENVTVRNNTFTGNNLGIYVFDTQTTLTGITVNFNNFGDNSLYGVWNQGGQPLNATGNWWGHAAGPGGAGPGQGDAISTSVLYSPWLAVQPGTAPMTWGVDPTSSIQGAIDIASPGDTIRVASGGYGGNLNITKSLSLQSADGLEVTTIGGSVNMALDGEEVLFGGEDSGFTVDAGGGAFAIRLSLNNGSEATISHSILTGGTDGITTRNGLLRNSILAVNHSEISHNDYGIYLESVTGTSTVAVESNNLAANDNYGLYIRNSTVIADATDNWWGDASGPSGGVADPSTGRVANGTGVAVSTNVRFDPWLTTWVYTLTISSTGSGSVVKPGEGVFEYAPGTVVELIGMSGTFYDFDEWTGDVRNIVNVNAAVTNITMNGDYSITANFKFSFWCFIATAAYGSDTARQLDILREFRDTVLLRNGLGVRFVSFYYRIGPPIASLMSRHEVFRTAVRVGFVDPIVRVLNWTHSLWSRRGS